MFTGLVSAIGRIVDVHPLGSGAAHGLALSVTAPPGWLDDVQPGDSIAINGACMTATMVDAAAGCFAIDVSAESLRATTGLDAPGDVNLEKSLRAQDRLGGHLVAGHVDGVGTVAAFEPVGESWRLVVAAPRSLARYFAPKGSVAVNGVSLTVNEVSDGVDATAIAINIIPHTLAHTTLGALAPGARVNLEVDLLARYVERMLAERGLSWN